MATDGVSTGSCPARTDPLTLNITQIGSDLTIDIVCDNEHLDPAGGMVTHGTLSEPSFVTTGELEWDRAEHTDANLDGTVVSADAISGTYRAETCNNDSGVCWCFKSGTFEVTRD